MRLVVGLGNPGRDYEGTRHNAGFAAVDALAAKEGLILTGSRFRALTAATVQGGEKVILVKPMTYMNASGEAVRDLMAYYRVKPDDLLVLYDDIDIGLGSLRIRPFGSAGTHNGMKSIIYQIRTDRFPRIRIGTGGDRKGDLAAYVLAKFREEERPLMRDALGRAADAVCCWLEEGIEQAMNRFNTPRGQGTLSPSERKG